MVYEVQHGIAFIHTENKSQAAVLRLYLDRIDKRWWKNRGQLVGIADTCLGFIIPALLIGLKMNAIECASVDSSTRVLMSYIP